VNVRLRTHLNRDQFSFPSYSSSRVSQLEKFGCNVKLMSQAIQALGTPPCTA
jgi:hypothetical protein